MFPRPEIAEAAKKLVLVELYTDGTDKESEENQKLQDEKFATVAIPYYAIIDPDGKVMSPLRQGHDQRHAGISGVFDREACLINIRS